MTLSLSGLPDAAAIEVDATRACQTIDGFGASSAWIDEKITTDLATLFWQDDTLNGHIGLSILRTRIDPVVGYTSSEASPMKKARQANPNVIIWSTSWIPPEEFQTDGLFNSDSASMQGFADYLVNYVQNVKKNAGIDLYAVSCQNEPDVDLADYEGCNWTGKQLRVFVRDYWGPACEKAGITAKRMIGESVRSDLAMSNPSLTDTAAAKYVDIIGTHLYYGGPYQYPLADSLHKPYWVTEICGLKDADTSIANGIMWANQIHDCLVRCNMNAYHYWWLVNNNANDDEGLCNSNGRPTPRMYTLGNFSKFIRPGFVRIPATDSPAADVKTSAYYGSSSNRLVIVAINSGAETNLDITIPSIPEGKTAVPWLTDSTHRLERQQPVDLSESAFSYTLPSQSVVTFVLPDVDITLGLKTEPSRPSIRIPRSGVNCLVEVPSAGKPWTIQIVTLSGRELMRKRVPRGCHSVVIEDRRHCGIVLVRTLQDGIVRTSPLLLTR
ncbi:MAG: hypothetical protein JW913_06445 [Chitinispirillaceae bacterium]|nr:hypothetical protein [Chitinispirillaceae bacterium]